MKLAYSYNYEPVYSDYDELIQLLKKIEKGEPINYVVLKKKYYLRPIIMMYICCLEPKN